MATIQQDDVIRSVADALQYISFYHPVDYITNLARAYELEQSPAAKDAIAQILINSRMCAEGHRPICQDTGIVTAFVKVGMEVQWAPSATFGMMTMQQMVDEGVREAWRNSDNVLRPSILADPAFTRRNTGDNTPAMVVVELVAGAGRRHHRRLQRRRLRSQIQVRHAQPLRLHRRLGPQNRPHHGRRLVPSRHARHRHRRHRRKGHGPGQGVPHGPHRHAGAHRPRRPTPTSKKLRIELYNKVNQLGIGAQGLGGLTTVLDIKIMDFPTHAANLPVAMIPNCAATRHLHIHLDGSGPVMVAPPSLDAWPKLAYDAAQRPPRQPRHRHPRRRQDLEARRSRPALRQTPHRPRRRPQAPHRHAQPRRKAPRRLHATASSTTSAPSTPSATKPSAPPAPPPPPAWTSSPARCSPSTGLLGMIGKAERGPAAIDAIREFEAVYLMAVGGAAYLVSKAIKSARVLAFADLGMEAIYEFEVSRHARHRSRRRQGHQRPPHRPRRMASPHRPIPTRHRDFAMTGSS